jgi:hypothetical protein
MVYNIVLCRINILALIAGGGMDFVLSGLRIFTLRNLEEGA